MSLRLALRHVPTCTRGTCTFVDSSSSVLGRLAAPLPPAGGDEAPSSPACRYPTCRNGSADSVSASSTAFPRGAGPLAPFLERPSGTQCSSESNPRCLDHALWNTRRLCCFSRPPNRLSLAYRVRLVQLCSGNGGRLLQHPTIPIWVAEGSFLPIGLVIDVGDRQSAVL